MLGLKSVKTLISKHKRLAAELVLSLLLALSVGCGITLHNNNKRLSEGLETAQNNIEAYQELVSNSQQAFTVLQMDMNKLKYSKDSVLLKLDEVRKQNDVKSSSVKTAATQTQTLLVNSSKGVRGDLVEILKDTIYTDSIKYNNLTGVKYTIGRDTVNIQIDLLNEQYLFTYKTREYKNKKSFFKRLFTLDFKKVDKYKYKIVNSNDLLKGSNIRIIEQ